MAPKYFSKEWFEEIKKKMNSDKAYQEKAKSLTYKSQYLVTDCPGGVDKLIEWTLEKGILTDYKIEEKPTPSEFRKMPFDGKKYFMRVTGSYKTFSKLHLGQLSPMNAIMQKTYKIEGPMLKIMTMMGPIGALNDLMAGVPFEMEEV